MAEHVECVVAAGPVRTAAVPGGRGAHTCGRTAAEDGGSYTTKRGETPAHRTLKRAALLWAQARGYSACGLEVNLPHSRYRADVAAYRPERDSIGTTAIFECKQVRCDLRRDNCDSTTTRKRLELVCRRREVIERNLRVHYPNLRIADSLFPEFASHDFAAIEHRGYSRLLRELSTLQARLFDCTKFETLVRYRCANLFFLVLPEALFTEGEVPPDWGALVERNGALGLVRKPVWQESPAEKRLRLLQRIAAAGTRKFNQELQALFDVLAQRGQL